MRLQLSLFRVDAFAGPSGTFRQRTEISLNKGGILARLGIDVLPKIYQLIPVESR